jgi:hypothetical protein
MARTTQGFARSLESEIRDLGDFRPQPKLLRENPLQLLGWPAGERARGNGMIIFMGFAG